MPTENVLVNVNTIANLTGIEAARASLLSLQAETIAFSLGLAALVLVGKAAVENAQKQEDAWGQLEQAYGAAGDSLDRHKEAIQNFIAENAKYIEDQYDTETAMAAVLRAGFSTEEMLRIVNDALDIAAIKHIAVSDAVNIEINSLIGNRNTLKQLGVSQAEYDAIMKDKTLSTAQKHAALLDLIEQKYKSGKQSLGELKESQNELNISWQEFTAKIGPPLLVVWGKINQALATAVGLLSVYYDLLGKIGDLERAALKGGGSNAPTGPGFNPRGARAGGGPVGGGDYLVGEQGPEVRHFGAAGSIVPNHALGGGGGGHHFHFHDAVYADGPGLDRLARMLIQRGRFTPGT